MKSISLKISLEPYKARVPLIFPSIIDGEVAYVLSGSTIENRKNGNYGGIPLNVEPKIVGYLRRFTSEMAQKYGNYEKVFTYTELWEIFTFFQKYYSYLYSNETVYTDMQDYINNVKTFSESERDSLLDMDRVYKEYGGEGFYEWLLDYYFGILDFRLEYQKFFNKTITDEWSKCIEHLPAIMYYVDAYEFYQKLSQMHDKYHELYDEYKNRNSQINEETEDEEIEPLDIINCRNADDCCECAEYFSFGGNDVFDIMTAWLNRMNNNLEFLRNVSIDMVSSLVMPVNLEYKVEDFGNFDIFSKEYVAGQEYNVGNVCTYDGDVYILKQGKGYKIDSETDVPVFDTNSWQKYIDYMSDKGVETGADTSILPSDYTISGRTVSILEEFQTYTVDAMGNPLPGIYRIADSGTTIPHPIENSILDLPYEMGKVINLERLDETHFVGDLLYAAHFYPCNANGKRVSNAEYTAHGEDVMECLTKAIEAAHKVDVWDEVVGVEFEYYKGALLTHNTYSSGGLEVTKNNGNPLGVKCVDKCTLTPKNTLYHLSAGESYPIQYYDINYDIETRASDVYDKDTPYKMCTFYIYPKSFEGNRAMLMAAPLFRRDETLGFVGPEKVIDNIYIDRGYATVLDRHLKVCEVNSLDDLTAYGNGSFDIIDIENQGEN